jgi:hypothetical protein
MIDHRPLGQRDHDLAVDHPLVVLEPDRLEASASGQAGMNDMGAGNRDVEQRHRRPARHLASGVAVMSTSSA